MLVGVFPEGGITLTSRVEPFERGVEVISRGLDSTPVIPVYLDGLWGHAFSRKGGRVFASPLRLRHKVTVFIGEPITGVVDAGSLRQRVLELGALAGAGRPQCVIE
jgi:1-acyl-sn-glycerol-3-phosphate acyltransferase